MQWLHSMERKTCKLRSNKICKVCDDHCCVHEAISFKCRIEVILNCDSFTLSPSVIRAENLPQMRH